MSTYLELKQQAEALLVQAEQAKQEETKAVLDGIANQMALYGLTVDDIARHVGGRQARGTVTKSAKPAKYIDPASKKTWNGFGRAPGWMPEDKSQWAAFLIQA